MKPMFHMIIFLTIMLLPQTVFAKTVQNYIINNRIIDILDGIVRDKTVTCYSSNFVFTNRKRAANFTNFAHLFENSGKEFEVKAHKYLVADNGDEADFSTIQAAIDAASDGDRIYVCPGIYEEKIKIRKDIELIALGGADSTSIDASDIGDGTVVTVSGSALIQGFTITGATSDFYCYYGGGIKISGEAGQTINYPIIQHNKIINNTGCKAGAIHLGGLSTSTGVNVSNSAIIRNNIIAGNHSSTGQSPIMIACNNSVNSVIENNVIANNSTASGYGALQIADRDCNTDIRNNIFYGNISSQENWGPVHDFDGGASIEYNCIFANTGSEMGGTGNLNDNPLFIDDENYHLDPTSPCANTGDPNSSYDDVDGSRNDMGAYGGAHGDW